MIEVFKYDRDKMEETMDLYLANDGWKEVYEKAPSDECRRFLRMTFYRSQNGEPSGDEAKELKEDIFKKLGKEDWEYLYDVFPGPFRAVCKKHMM